MANGSSCDESRCPPGVRDRLDPSFGGKSHRSVKSYAFLSRDQRSPVDVPHVEEEIYMRRLSRSVVLALGFMLGSGSAAHALNFCFNPGTATPSLAVAEKFRKPAPGSCSPINGIDIGDPGQPRRLV